MVKDERRSKRITERKAEKQNGSFFCLGARALGGWSGNLLGSDMPFSIFQQMVTGMEKSSPGFPYKAYPE